MVVDSWALLEWIFKGSASHLVRAALRSAETNGEPLLMSWMNTGEVYYTMARRTGPKSAEEFLNVLAALPIRCVMPTEEDVLAAARLKTQYPISYADAFAAGLAIKHGVPVLTGDPEFLTLKKHLSIQWIGAGRKR